jgi:hypothetical protein
MVGPIVGEGWLEGKKDPGVAAMVLGSAMTSALYAHAAKVTWWRAEEVHSVTLKDSRRVKI